MAPASAMVAAALVWARTELPARGPQLAERVLARVPETGVGNPVTAVLLDFRGYDTLLEVAVLVLALVAVRSLGGLAAGAPGERSLDGGARAGGVPTGGVPGGRAPGEGESHGAPPGESAATTGPVLDGLARTVAPVAVVAAGYLWWTGSHAPGGAFQGAAVLTAAGILLLLAGKLDAHTLEGPLARGLAGGGLIVFLLVGAAGALFGDAFLDYPAAVAGTAIVLLEAVLTVSIAAVLLSLFAALR
jgi:multisubunit Na+/H+ antiporter MnhB subunit